MTRTITTVDLPVRWQRAVTQVLGELAEAPLDAAGLNCAGLAAVFDQLVEGARTCASAGSAALTLCVPQPGWLRIAAATGDGAEWAGRLIPLEGSVSALSRTQGGAIRVADTATDPRTVQSARRAGIGPSMVVPLYTETGEWDGTLLAGRPVSADQFTEDDLRFFAEYATQAWRAITFAAANAVRIADRHTAVSDRLTNVLQEVTAHDLAALQATTEQLHAQLPPEHWPRLAPLSAAIATTRDHLARAFVAGDGRDQDETGPLLAHLLRTCTAVAGPLELAQQFTVHDPLPSELPARKVDLIGRWLAIALLVADHLGVTRAVDIATRTTTEQQLALTVSYQGRPPAAGADAATLAALQAVTDGLGGLHSIDVPAPETVRLTWISDPLR